MKKLALILALLALPLFASPNLFSKYESVRQGLLKGSLAETQKSAAALATEAKTAKQTAIAEKAEAVAKSADLKAARDSFASLSDEMMKLREAAKGDKPSVYYCPMVKKSWLQPKGEVGNPYDAAMAKCGMLKSE
ncbi:MAG TPA: hypothetical protein VHW00_07415 [Thermoanaerobaculia bacterium]|nr:hypothetical protein [Thermoanaerobaculia bacterium]